MSSRPRDASLPLHSLLKGWRPDFLAKIAVEDGIALTHRCGERHRVPPEARMHASGHGWAVSDVICTAGPHDKPFEEQHSRIAIAVVVSGTFQYQTSTGRELMVPGSLLLGNSGEYFTCGHEHGAGDRCVSFSYTPEFCEQLGVDPDRRIFHAPRLPPVRAFSGLVAAAATLLGAADREVFEEVAIRVLDVAVRSQNGSSLQQSPATPGSLARITQAIRAIESDPGAPHELASLARIARLSPYHFLRSFNALTGTTPRQYLLRTRLRRAAIRLKNDGAKILDIALDCGFGDVSNFNRAFRSEFGLSPRAYRRTMLRNQS